MVYQKYNARRHPRQTPIYRMSCCRWQQHPKKDRSQRKRTNQRPWSPRRGFRRQQPPCHFFWRMQLMPVRQASNCTTWSMQKNCLTSCWPMPKSLSHCTKTCQRLWPATRMTRLWSSCARRLQTWKLLAPKRRHIVGFSLYAVCRVTINQHDIGGSSCLLSLYKSCFFSLSPWLTISAFFLSPYWVQRFPMTRQRQMLSWSRRKKRIPLGNPRQRNRKSEYLRDRGASDERLPWCVTFAMGL